VFPPQEEATQPIESVQDVSLVEGPTGELRLPLTEARAGHRSLTSSAIAMFAETFGCSRPDTGNATFERASVSRVIIGYCFSCQLAKWCIHLRLWLRTLKEPRTRWALR
jgi:hypothetical protein